MELLKSMFRLQQSGTMCDVVLQSGENSSVSVHSLVLAAASSNLCTILSEQRLKSQYPFLIETNIPQSTLELLMRHVYTGQCGEPEEVQHAANNLGINLMGTSSCVSTGMQTENGRDLALEGTSSTNLSEGIKTQNPSELFSPYDVVENLFNQPESMEDSSHKHDNTDMQRHNMVSCTDFQCKVPGFASARQTTDQEHANVKTENISVRQGATHSLDTCNTRLSAVSGRPENDKEGDAESSGTEGDDTWNDELSKLAVKIEKVDRVESMTIGANVEGTGVDEQSPSHENYESSMLDCKPFEAASLCQDDPSTNMTTLEDSNSFNIDDLKCNVCMRSFKNIKILKRHKKLCPSERAKDCLFCVKKFRTKKFLKKHLIKSHQMQCQVGNQKESEIGKRKECELGNPKQTDMCNDCNYCPQHGTPQPVTKPGTKPAAKPSKQKSCQHCGKTFTRKRELERHERTHNKAKKNITEELTSLTCEPCNKTYSTAHKLKDHLRRNHGVGVRRVHACKLCDRVYYTSSSLNHHMYSHSDEKKFACKYCNKLFRFESGVRIHQKIHTGEKPFTCTQCGKSFRVLHSLQVHEETHREDRAYACSYCGDTFKLLTCLKKHEKMHTTEKKFTCSYCQKAFRRASHLEVHERTHTGEKPFSCEVCGKAFTDKRNLVGHQKVHAKLQKEVDTEISETDKFTTSNYW